MSNTSRQGSCGGSDPNDGLVVTIAASSLVFLQNNPHVIHAISVSQPVQSWTVIRDHVDFLAMDNALGGVLASLAGSGGSGNDGGGGIPSCPPVPPELLASASPSDPTAALTASQADLLVRSRHGAQQWLSRILSVAAARESPVMRQFLCYGANVVPPQFQAISWITFGGGHSVRQQGIDGGLGQHLPSQQQQQQQQQQQHAPQAGHPVSNSYASVAASRMHAHPNAAMHTGNTSNTNANANANNSNRNHQHHVHHPQPIDEMDMDEMFAFENDHHHSSHHSSNRDPHHHQDHDDDDDTTAAHHHDDHDAIQYDSDAEYYAAANRYQPTEYEPLTPSELMEMNEEMGNTEVEMVEDVGSLAQSLGASHLGRSLGLQKEMASYKMGMERMHQQHQNQQNQNQLQNQGVVIGGNRPPNSMAGLPGFGGIGQTLGMNASSSGADHAAVTATSPSSSSPTPGGIAGAMAMAAKQSYGTDLDGAAPPPQESLQPHVPGLGDSFYRKAPVSAPRLDSFKMIKVIGKGSFGKVFLVKEKRTNEMFALKVLKKDNIIKRNQVEHTKTERSVLGYVKHPFIVGLTMAFQSKDKLYFVLDYCAGGELFFHLGKVGKFDEPRACFYAAEITLAIAYVHDLDIVYRDLKPENVLLDSRGHVRLTDFGLSKEGISSSSSGANSFCGTPEYLAPEILNRQGHGRAVDWWSLGALLYEMLTGLPPFYCRDREKLFEKIRKGVLDYPRYLTPRAQLILRGLLTKDPRRRLGSGPNDAEDIKQQEFFEDLDWKKLMAGEVAPPWDPQINGSMDTSQFDHEFTNMPLNSPGAFGGHGFGTTPSDNVFEGFTFTDRAFYAPPGHKP
mmetsp:Transcript_19389/g.40597  ORF Transcript_19389/g.40597 Transcript_19389/m.40597 type:complete len:847 (+) Transcript_19389:688-3228(+)